MRKYRSSSQHGAVMVESASAMVLFLFVVLLACDTALVFYRAATVQFALSSVARESLVYRQLSSGTMTAGELKSRVKRKAGAMGVDLNTTQVRICTAGDVGCDGDQIGDGFQLMQLSVNPNLKMFWQTVPVNFIAKILISRESSTN